LATSSVDVWSAIADGAAAESPLWGEALRADPEHQPVFSPLLADERYGALFRHLLERGIYVAPSQFEAMFVSLAHSDDDIDRTVEAVGELPRGD